MPWAVDEKSALTIIGEALAAVPDIAGEQSIDFSTAPTLDRFRGLLATQGRDLQPTRFNPGPDQSTDLGTLPSPATDGPDHYSGGSGSSAPPGAGDGPMFVVETPSANEGSPEGSGHPSMPRDEAFILPDYSAFAPRATFDAPPEELPRHPRITVDGPCKVGMPVPLSISLLPEADGQTLPAFDVPFPPGAADSTLVVMVYGRNFEVGPDVYQILRVPRQGASETAVFQLTPREAGEQSIDVKFLASTRLVGHCAITLNVSQAVTADPQTIVLDPVQGLASAAGQGARLRLRISKAENGRLDYISITDKDPVPRNAGMSPKTIDADAAARWTAQFGPLIQAFQTYDLSPADMRGVLGQLASIGVALLEQILAIALADEIRRLPKDAVIAIETTDDDAEWIPWELLAFEASGPLFGDRFTLIRSPVIQEPPGPAPAPDAGARLQRALLVVGDNIKSKPDQLPRKIFGKMEAKARPPLVEGDWDDLASRIPAADIVHFACHGGGWPNSLSYGPNPARKLVPRQAGALGLRHGTVVFANACDSATASLVLAQFQSFGREFYIAGARPFIGTLGPVPENEAVIFSSYFYDAFAVEGLPAGQAMQKAKAQAKSNFKVPIWLFYCLYGSEAVTRRW